jgi:phospholipid-binding lipoprotein MlaA
MLSGCATSGNPRDPLEPLNRKVFAFNEAVDKVILRPAAKGYVAVVPQLARRGVSNFFNNLGMIITTLNDAFQLKGSKVPLDVARFSTNLVFGLGGLIDVASELRIESRNEDFGQTLGYYGVKSGPYLMLPFFGPSSFRDAPGLAVDFFSSPVVYFNPEANVRWGMFVLDVVDTRANLLGAEKFLNAAAIDRYSFLRDAYLQRREYLVHDGDRPTSTPGGTQEKTLRELEEEDMMDDSDDPVPLRALPRVIKP